MTKEFERINESKTPSDLDVDNLQFRRITDILGPLTGKRKRTPEASIFSTKYPDITEVLYASKPELRSYEVDEAESSTSHEIRERQRPLEIPGSAELDSKAFGADAAELTQADNMASRGAAALAGGDALSGIIKLGDPARVAKAVAEYRDEALDIVKDAISYFEQLGKQSNRARDIARGELAARTIIDCIPELATMLRISTDAELFTEIVRAVGETTPNETRDVPTVYEAHTTLKRLRSELNDLPAGIDGARRLVVIHDRAISVAFAVAIGLALGAAYNESIKGAVTALVTAVGGEVTGRSIGRSHNRNRLRRASQAHARLMARTDQYWRLSLQAVPELDDDRVIARSGVKFGIWGAKATTVDVIWPTRTEYWQELDLLLPGLDTTFLLRHMSTLNRTQPPEVRRKSSRRKCRHKR